jgi:hypothetical protein
LRVRPALEGAKLSSLSLPVSSSSAKLTDDLARVRFLAGRFPETRAPLLGVFLGGEERSGSWFSFST